MDVTSLHNLHCSGVSMFDSGKIVRCCFVDQNMMSEIIINTWTLSLSDPRMSGLCLEKYVCSSDHSVVSDVVKHFRFAHRRCSPFSGCWQTSRSIVLNWKWKPSFVIEPDNADKRNKIPHRLKRNLMLSAFLSYSCTINVSKIWPVAVLWMLDVTDTTVDMLAETIEPEKFIQSKR